MHETPNGDFAMKLRGAGAYAAPKGRDFPPHQHQTWELVYYRTGHIVCPVGEEVYQAHPGMMLLTPPRTVHSERAVTEYSNYYLTIEAPVHHTWPRLCLDDSDRSLGSLCGALGREWNSLSWKREEMLSLLVTQLDLLIRRQGAQQGLPEAEKLVLEVEQLIEKRYALPLQIGQLAREVGVSASSLRAKFKAVRGSTPMEYLHEVRTRQAIALLRSSDLTLEAVAALSGFHSASHLSRYIQRATGKSPGNLRGRS